MAAGPRGAVVSMIASMTVETAGGIKRANASACARAVARRSSVGSAPSSSPVCMLLIVLPQPVHAVIVLRVAHDGVDVMGFLNGEFDDQPRSMHPIIEGAANVVGGAAPGKMQLLAAGASNGV